GGRAGPRRAQPAARPACGAPPPAPPPRGGRAQAQHPEACRMHGAPDSQPRWRCVRPVHGLRDEVDPTGGPVEDASRCPPERGGTMAHPNEDLVRRGYEAFATGDMATLNELFADDVVWHAPGHNELAGTFRGKDEVFANLQKNMELTGGTFKLEIHDLLADDE